MHYIAPDGARWDELCLLPAARIPFCPLLLVGSVWGLSQISYVVIRVPVAVALLWTVEAAVPLPT